eukprot:GHVR01186880.1.p1 GENE.GHVR01186880.1~~GHVR01186880.1.p1  ORF type:complete len:371 (+),score=19.73 GHVR01186880.1:824-1936(+)
MAAKTNQTTTISEAQMDRAEIQIRDFERSIRYNVTDFTVEFLADKVDQKEYYIPSYQRHFTWTSEKRCKLIESVMLGLPIPPVFLWIADDGRIEIVDGSQRLRTLHEFIFGDLRLEGLDMLNELNGVKYCDIPLPRQRKFKAKSLRGFVLDNNTTVEYRTEMFQRVNMGGSTLNSTEYRIGALPGPMTDLVQVLAKDQMFESLTPMSKSKEREREREELLFRFFAYVERAEFDGSKLDFPKWNDRPSPYLNSFVDDYNKKLEGNAAEEERLRNLLSDVLAFVTEAFPNGFLKLPNSKSVPRVRFEAISVGVGLLVKRGELPHPGVADIASWIDGADFNAVSTSGSANVRAKLTGRIEFVMNKIRAVNDGA